MAETVDFFGTPISRIGYGAMGLSAFYGKPKEEDHAVRVIRKAVDIGCTFIDTAAVYGWGHNERLLAAALNDSGLRKKVFLATKFVFINSNGQVGGVDASRDAVRATVDKSIADLGGVAPDLLYEHRRDDKVPVEDLMATFAELQKEGKTKYIGLSECSAETLRKACKVAQVHALQVEYSLWSTQIERNGLLQAARDNGVKIIAYSPIGRGFLSGKYKDGDDFEDGDFRKANPRFVGEAAKQNLKLVEEVRKVADRLKATPAQVALAWLLAQGDDIIPIPGTTSEERLIENFDARKLKLSETDLAEIRDILKNYPVSGERYSGAMAQMVEK